MACTTSMPSLELSLAVREHLFPMVLSLLFILGTAGPPEELLQLSVSICPLFCVWWCGPPSTPLLCRGSSPVAMLMCDLLALVAFSQNTLCCLLLLVHCPALPLTWSSTRFLCIFQVYSGSSSPAVDRLCVGVRPGEVGTIQTNVE